MSVGVWNLHQQQSFAPKMEASIRWFSFSFRVIFRFHLFQELPSRLNLFWGWIIWQKPPQKGENGPCLLFGFEHGIGRGFTEEFRDTLAATGDLNHAGPVGGWWLPSGEKKATSEWKGGKKEIERIAKWKELNINISMKIIFPADFFLFFCTRSWLHEGSLSQISWSQVWW